MKPGDVILADEIKTKEEFYKVVDAFLRYDHRASKNYATHWVEKEDNKYLVFDTVMGLVWSNYMKQHEKLVPLGDIIGYYSEEEMKEFVTESPLEEFRREIRDVLRKHAIQAGSKHYTDQVIDPIAIAYLNDLSGPQLKVLKYVMRYEKKDGKKDLMKACDVLYKMLQYEYDTNPEEIHAYCTGR